MNVQTAIGFGATALALTLGLSAIAPQSARASACFDLGPIVICPDGGNPGNGGGVKPVTPTKTYVVTETNPFTGGNVSTQTFQNRQQAQQHLDLLRPAHWAEWQYAGIGWHWRANASPSL